MDPDLQNALDIEMALEIQAESNREMDPDLQNALDIEMALEIQAESNREMADYNWGEETDEYCGEEAGYNWGEETDEYCGEETSYNLGEEVTSADEVSIRTGENIATAGDTQKELPSAIVQTEDSDVSEDSLQPFRSPQRFQWNPSKQHLVTNVKEMIEDTKEVREKLTSLSVRRESEEESVTSADKVSIHRGENIATAGDTHEDLPSAIVQTEDSVVSEESLQDLSENIGKCWKVVGRKLKLTEGQLENLEDTNHPTLQEKIYQMLLVWKRKRGSAGTYVVLGDALKKAGRVDLQEDLLKTYEPT